MRESLPNVFIYVKRVKLQEEFPGNQIQFPGSQNPLDRIFYTYERDDIEREWRRLDPERSRQARKRLQVEEEKENSDRKGGTKESTNESTKECKKVPKKKIMKLVKKTEFL